MPQSSWYMVFMLIRMVVCAVVCGFALLPATAKAEEQRLLRVGMFNNITHAHALIARDMAAEGHCWYAQRLPGVTIQWHAYNAGPTAMEAMLEGKLDLAYTGPIPVLSAHLRSDGKGVRILSGAVRGGAALLAHGSDKQLNNPKDFKGKRIATPQIGNTQDLACRAWLRSAGLDVRLIGGDVSIMPVANPDQLIFFNRDQVDAVWTVEPWVSLLEQQGGARIVYSESVQDSITTVLVGSVSFLKAEPQIVEAFVRAHEELTRWITDHPAQARHRVVSQLSRNNRQPFPMSIVERAWSRLAFSSAIADKDLNASIKTANQSGFIKFSAHPSELLFRRP